MNFSNRPQFRRIQDMVSHIREGMQTEKRPNASMFRKGFGVSRATVMRGLDFLRDELGAPIEYDASMKSYYLTDPSWAFPSLKLERKEVFALGIARKLMTAFRGTPLESEMRSVMAKVTDSLEGHISKTRLAS